MNTDTHIDVFPGGGPKAGYGADRRSRDVRAAVPVLPSAFLAGVGPFGPRRRNRPVGKGRANLVKSAAKLEAGRKNLARSMAGAILIAAIGLSWPSGANAFLITQTGTSGGSPGGLPVFDVSGLLAGDSFNLIYDDLSGALDVTAMVTLDALSATSATISVSIDNMSADPDSDGEPRITVFGLSIDGFSSIDGSSTAGFLLDQFDDGNFPGFGDVVACATAASCTTGAGGGIEAGMTDAFVLMVSGTFGATMTLDSFVIKVQGGPDGDDGDSYELPGTPSPVPVPAALPLFLSALAGLGLIGWRRNRAAA